MRVRTPRGSGQIGYRMTRRRHDFGHPHAEGWPLRTLATWLLASLAAIACIVFPPTAHALGAPAGAQAPEHGSSAAASTPASGSRYRPGGA